MRTRRERARGTPRKAASGLAGLFAAAMAANADDWADDHAQPTPAQRAAAIADKAVDAITNQGYHYWCAHGIAIVAGYRTGAPHRALAPAHASVHACALAPYSFHAFHALLVLGAAQAHSLPTTLPTHGSASHERRSGQPLNLALTQARHGAQGRGRGASAGADRALILTLAL